MSKTHYSYSGTFEETATEVHAVAEVADLRKHIERFQKGDHAHSGLTLRGTGNALDRQSLGKDTVLELEGLPHEVVVHAAETVVDGEQAWPTCETTGWTTWETVLRACLRLDAPAQWNAPWDVPGSHSTSDGTGPHRCRWEGSTEPHPVFVPYVVPSSGRITIGGGIAGDTIWRYSSLFGKESRSVLWLDVLTYRTGEGGQREAFTMRLLNPELGDFKAQTDLHGGSRVATGLPKPGFAGGPDENAELFYAVIGGHGMTGPVVRVKYLLFTVKEGYDHTNFNLVRPTDEEAFELPDVDESEMRDYKEEVESSFQEEGDDKLIGRPLTWPEYPHADRSDIEAGASFEDATKKVYNLTWMFVAKDADTLFDRLVAHHFAFKEDLRGNAIPLPREVNPNVVAAFGLFFPMAKKPRYLLGNLAYGTRRGKPHQLAILRRENVWDNLWLVRWMSPGGARFAEKVALERVFQPVIDGSAGSRGDLVPSMNGITDFALFMEGHTIGLQKARRQPVGTVQATWFIPVHRASEEKARESFSKLLDALHRACRRRPSEGGIAIQSCDIKVIPPGKALLAAERTGDATVAVTVGIESGDKYVRRAARNGGYGLPSRALGAISDALYDDGVRVHLTKNVFASDETLKATYAKKLAEFAAARKKLDPDLLYTSRFFQEVLHFHDPSASD